MWHGETVPPLQAGPRGRRRPSRRRDHLRRRRSDSELKRPYRQDPLEFDPSRSMQDFFKERTPPADSVLRKEDPNFVIQKRCGVPDTDGIRRRDRMSMDVPGQLFT